MFLNLSFGLKIDTKHSKIYEIEGIIMSENYFSFAALSGIQGRKGNYLIQVPLKVLSKFLREENTQLPVEQRSQRILNKARVSQIVKYMVDNPDSYILPPLVAYINAGEVNFERFDGTVNLGRLKISLDADVRLFDGQHRRAAIEEAVKFSKYLGDEYIAVMLYSNGSIEAAQQVFADININATKPAQSIKLLFNHRDRLNKVTREVIDSVPLFKEYVDYERTNLPSKSKMFFTFSGIYQVTKTMLKEEKISDNPEIIHTFWQEVSINIQQWANLGKLHIEPVELRDSFVHAHSVIWLAIAEVGCYLIKHRPTDWMQYVERLQHINWSRTDPQWQGRCVISGRISKARQNIILSSNLIFKNIGIPLPEANQQIEDTFVSIA